MTEPKADNTAGFTIIEALVALAILAIASAALITAAEAHVRRVDQVADRARAQWIAQNHLAELSIGAGPNSFAPVQMGGRTYKIDLEIRETDDPAIQRVQIGVQGARSSARLATLDGFIPVETNR